MLCILLFTVFVYFQNCAPIAPIQSARVTGKTGAGISYISESHLIESIFTDTNSIDFKTLKIEQYDYTVKTVKQQVPTSGFFRIGMNNRTEISLFILPLFFRNLFYLNIKVACFDIGSDVLFRNISLAGFTGGNYVSSTKLRMYSIWGGLIFGTHCPVKKSELELVILTYGSHCSQHDQFQHPTNVKQSISFSTINFSFGLIFKPTKYRFLELNTGITSRINLGKHYNVDLSDTDINSATLTNFPIYPIVFQLGAQLYIPHIKKSKEL